MHLSTEHMSHNYSNHAYSMYTEKFLHLYVAVYFKDFDYLENIDLGRRKCMYDDNLRVLEMTSTLYWITEWLEKFYS